MALLCLVTLVAGFLSLRRPAGESSTAIRVDAAAGAVPAATGETAPQTPAPADASISLHELALALKPRPTTPTTRLRATTTTTRKPASTTTTAKPTTTTTSARPAPAPAPAIAPPPATVTPLTPLTTIVAAVVPPAAAVSGAVTRTDSGVASWFKAPAATCAHRTLPMGTMIKVTRIHNGASATCKVDDRGPTLETGRLIDLSLDTFEKLAAREAGLIDVRIEW
ncbi:MAG: septal ring lytic transglycosylase RlpA family protein [Acidimicrobiales bacterium]|nr:septal ring lytic transglycosylase RlpA family protein [Acidimicrobiales bacterium]